MTGQQKNEWVKCPSGEFERLQQRWWYGRVKHLIVTSVAALTASGAVALAAWEIGHLVLPNAWVSFSASSVPSSRQLPPCPEEFGPQRDSAPAPQ